MRNKLISYALDFTSFLLENRIEPRNVLLFGSVITGELDKESDVDIFIDIDKTRENEIKNVLLTFNKTFGEMWKLKGISNPISLKVGNLEKWPDLRRSIQSYGITLYGKYRGVPENMKSFILFRLTFGGIRRAKKVRVWRELYGYSQKVGKKTYRKKGVINTLDGKKLEKSVILVSSEKSKELREFLIKNKIGFSVNEIWSDNL